MTSKPVIVITYGYGGHVPTYHNLFIRSLLNCGVDVYSACGWNQEVRAVFESNPDTKEKLKTPTLNSMKTEIAVRSAFSFLSWMPLSGVLWDMLRNNEILRSIRGRRRWAGARVAVDEIVQLYGLDEYRLLFTYIDEFLGAYIEPSYVDAMFPETWTCLYIWAERLSWSNGRARGFSRERVFSAKSCVGVGVLDETASNILEEAINPNKMITFPDVVDSTPPNDYDPIAKSIRNRANGRKVIGLVGQLTPRKGLVQFRWLMQNADPNKFFFAMVGECTPLQFDPLTRSWLEQEITEKDNLFRSLQRIPDDAAFNAICDSCDILWAVYPNFAGSSNVLGKAALLEKPVLVASGAGLKMEALVREWSLGRSVPPDKLSEILQHLDSLIEDLECRRDSFDFKGYRELISIDQFAEAVYRLVEV